MDRRHSPAHDVRYNDANRYERKFSIALKYPAWKVVTIYALTKRLTRGTYY